MRSTARTLFILAALLIVTKHVSGTAATVDAAESWESLRSRLIERRDIVRNVIVSGTTPERSEFRGRYIKPEYAHLYSSFVKLNPKTGLLERGKRIIRPLFTEYSQPAPSGGRIVNIPELDFDLLETDFAHMKAAGMNILVKSWSWGELLNYDGTWARVERQPEGSGLPYFRYVFQIYDYFLDRAQAHGLYVSIQPSLSMGLHPEVIPPQYRGKLLLHDELWSASKEAYARIIGYFSGRTVIAAVGVAGDDIIFEHSLDDPRMLYEFKRYVRKKYGSITNLRQTWTHGYDLTDRSGWTRRMISGREVMWPEYPFIRGVFDSWNSFDDVRLPVSDYCRDAANPDNLLVDLPTGPDSLARDPSWIDFAEMREQIVISRLNDLADTFRHADPNHVIFYLNPPDARPDGETAFCFDRGKLHFDIAGASGRGSTPDAAQEAASYSPYLGANDALPKGFAFEAAWTPNRVWSLTDAMGAGAALVHIGDWTSISGRTHDGPTSYDDRALTEIAEFIAVTADIPFVPKTDVRVLILRNKHAASGFSAAYDIANSAYLASILTRLHISFDILPDSDITPSAFEQGKVNLSKYRFIFVPAQYQLLTSRTWQMLEDWVSDPRYAGQRGLCLGLYKDQDSYFSPTQPTALHPAFRRLTGTSGYARRVRVSGVVNFVYERFFGQSARGDVLSLTLPENGEVGCFDEQADSLDTILALGSDGPPVIVRNLVNGNFVYTCGLYLGAFYAPAIREIDRHDADIALSSLYLGMLRSTEIQPEVESPDNIAIYTAADGTAIMLREREGKETDVTLGFRRMPGSIFAGVTTVFDPNGGTQVKDFTLKAYQTLVLRRSAGLSVLGGTDVSSVCKTTPQGGLECVLSGKGKITVTFQLKPGTIYSARENGELAMVFTVGPNGRQIMTFDLGNGSKPLLISVNPNKR